ncbi:MAG: hypothetical protein AAFV53_37430 [Myxococcota bacterium]
MFLLLIASAFAADPQPAVDACAQTAEAEQIFTVAFEQLVAELRDEFATCLINEGADVSIDVENNITFNGYGVSQPNFTCADEPAQKTKSETDTETSGPYTVTKDGTEYECTDTTVTHTQSVWMDFPACSWASGKTIVSTTSNCIPIAGGL